MYFTIANMLYHEPMLLEDVSRYLNNKNPTTRK